MHTTGQRYPSASEENFRQLESMPEYDAAVEILREYLDTAVPNAAATQQDTWSVSCLPTTNRTAEDRRLFTVNVGAIETYYLRLLTDDDGPLLSGTVFVTQSVLEKAAGRPVAVLKDQYDALDFVTPVHRAAGGDAVAVSWISYDISLDQFAELPLDTAARDLADRLTAAGPCTYARYHNPWLAQAALSLTPDLVS
ncbi:conserved hypothetical protein (plasmid) [Rhodococcus jostii RHA1]|uniref:Uncharacterized protein n=1 Tax=Rhodococcus jostii (strain RHA1) TaxID=101510 RepID=Q0RUT9_RHOJR|nr:hypothetical protein [Rhodococcus jostii]ABH00947.1 conserved hypothetical protein [Rhodococcus jostii RHA1]